MKKYFLMSMMVAAALFCGCSSDDDIKGQQSGINVDGTGYIAVTIHLPESSEATRANDNFDDGKASEYAVTTAHLVLFKGDKGEQDATYIGAYPIYNTPAANPPVNDNVTSVISHNNAIWLQNLSLTGTERLYGLVMVNTPSYFSILNDPSGENYGKMLVGGSEFSGTFGTLRDNVAAATNLSAFTGSSLNNFFMTNTILSTIDGKTTTRTGGHTMCLIDITDNVKSSASDALAARAIFRVERAVAKVTLTPSGTLATGGINLYDDSFTTPKGTMGVSVSGWQLINTASRSRLVRHWTPSDDANWLNLTSEYYSGSNNPYRFAGTQYMTDDAGRTYRTYFGLSHTGTLNSTLGTYQTTTGADNPVYCFENMLTVDNMIASLTTMAVIEVTFATTSPAVTDPYYTLNGDGSKFYTKNAIKTAIENYVKLIHTGTIVVTQTVDATTKKVTFAATYDGTDLTTEETTAMNAAFSVYEYTDHTAYYYVPIKHFGDDLTPWSGFSGTTTASVYPGTSDAQRDARWLGRYGILRNNWYDLSVSGVGKIGDVLPNPPSGDTPDDLQNSYIAAKINVLSWAKRVQSVVLQ